MRIEGEHREYLRICDKGDARTFSFCPTCGGTVYLRTENAPDIVAVPVGAFADPTFPKPTVSVSEKRRHGWADLPGLGGDSRHQQDDWRLGFYSPVDVSAAGSPHVW